MVTIAWHEVISWTVALVASVLFIVERRKSDGTKYYMSIQGIIKSCAEKMKLYAHLLGETKRGEINANQEHYRILLDSVYTDNLSLMQSLMGTMKAIEPKKEMPFDLDNLLNRSTAVINENDV